MIKKKTVLLDGGIGTSLWELAERSGISKDPVWVYNIEHPDLVSELHKRFIRAGSEIILANTFGANPPVVHRLSSYDPQKIISSAIHLAKQSTVGTDVKVAASFGPLTILLEPYGDLTDQECYDIFDSMIIEAIKAGADYINLQTFIDLSMLRIACDVVSSYHIPYSASLSFNDNQKTLFGNSADEMIQILSAYHPDAIGLNCSLGPVTALEILKEISCKTELPLYFKPNSGKPIIGPDHKVINPYTPEHFAKDIAPAIEYADYIGGCCGCNADFIHEIYKLLHP